MVLPLGRMPARSSPKEAQRSATRFWRAVVNFSLPLDAGTRRFGVAVFCGMAQNLTSARDWDGGWGMRTGTRVVEKARLAVWVA